MYFCAFFVGDASSMQDEQSLQSQRHPWAYRDSSVKGGRGADLPEILHIIFFLLALPKFPPLFCPNLGGQLPPHPTPLPRTPMATPTERGQSYINVKTRLTCSHISP